MSASVTSTDRAAESFPASKVKNSGIWFSANGGVKWQTKLLCVPNGKPGGDCLDTCGEFFGDSGILPCDITQVVVDPYNTENVYIVEAFDDVHASHAQGSTGFSPLVFPNPSGASGGFPAGLGQIGRATVAVGPPEGKGASSCPVLTDHGFYPNGSAARFT